MNIQTERLENHSARMIVELSPEKWEQSKKEAASKLSEKYRIPGFRKGKAPYNIVLRYLGESTIVEASMERLADEIYPKALDEAQLKPYASGSLENFTLEPQPTYTFIVPLQAEVELNNYRDIRVDYVTPEVTDEDFEKAMRQLQQEEALVEESTKPIQAGDRVTLDIHSEFADGHSHDDDDDDDHDHDDDDHDHDDDDDHDHDENVPHKGANFLHRHDAVINLDPADEPILPGFIAAMLGANTGENVEFELTIPDNDENYKDIAGRKIHFNIEVKKVENVTLPELNDELAARITAEEEEPLDLAKLQIRIRENLQSEAISKADGEYSDKVLDAIVEQAQVKFHEMMLKDRLAEMIENFGESLKQQGITLEMYQKVLGITAEALEEQYRPGAITSLTRSLVLGEIMLAEGITVTTDDINAKIEETMSQLGAGAEGFRTYLNRPEQRNNIGNNMLYERVMERLVKIGKGEIEAVAASTELASEGHSEVNTQTTTD